jgi:hypothetical protein
MTWFTSFASGWSSEIGLADFLLGVVGFTITIVAVLRSQRAAEAAAEAARNAKEALLHAAAIWDVAAALTTMEEVKRLHRMEAWPMLPERYSMLRRTLIAIRSTTPRLTDKQGAVLQGAIQHFSLLEEKVERALKGGKPLPDSTRLNKIVSMQADQLGEVLGALKLELGGKNRE